MNDVFERNLLALAKTRPSLVDQMARSPADPSYRYARVNGAVVIVREVDGAQTALSVVEDAAGRARTFADARLADISPDEPIALVGMLAGFEIREILQLDSREDWRTPRPIFVFEPDLDLFRINLAAADWTDVFESGRVVFFVGANATDTARDFFLADLARPLPTRVLPNPDVEAAQGVAEAIGRIKRETLDRAARAREAAGAHYAALSGANLARAFLTRDGMRVLVISNARSWFIRYAVRDIVDALEHMNVGTRVIEEKSPIDRLTVPLLLETVADFRPHALISINLLRGALTDALPAGLPIISWIQDFMHAVYREEKGRTLGERDLVVCATRGLVSRGYPPDAIFELPVLTNPRVYNFGQPDRSRDREGAGGSAPAINPPPDTQSSILNPRSSELAYVSNISWTAEQGLDRILAECTDEPFRRAVRSIADRIFAGDDAAVGAFADFVELVHPILATHGIAPERTEEIAFRVHHEVVAPLVRNAPLDWAAQMGIDLALWGRGWQSHPRLSRYARGIAENGPALAAIYRAARINLHVNQFGIDHPRIMDGLAAGGFFLVREAPDFGVLDLAGMTFSTRDEFAERLRFFLDNPDARAECVARNRERIFSLATYDRGVDAYLTYQGLRVAARENTAMPNADIESAAIARLVDAGLQDPRALGVLLRIEHLIASGDAPETARARYDALASYQQQFGASAWPIDMSIADARNNDADPILARLIDAARFGEDASGAATRLARSDAPLTPDQKARVDKTLASSRAMAPLHRRAYSDDAICRRRKDRSRLGAYLNNKEADALTAAFALVRAHWSGHALLQLTPFAESARASRWLLFETARVADAAGDREAALAFLVRTEIDSRRHIDRPVLAGRIAAQRAWTLAGLSRFAEASGALAFAGDDAWTRDLVRLTRARLALADGDRAGARQALGNIDTYEPGARRALAARLLAAFEKPATSGPFSIALGNSFDPPPDGARSIRKLLVDNEGRLVAITHGAKTFCYSETAGGWSRVDLFPSGDEAYASAVAFGNGKTYIANGATGEIVSRDGDADWRTMSRLAQPAFYEDAAVIHAANAFAVIDRYENAVRVLDVDRGHEQAVTIDESPARLATRGDGFSVLQNGRFRYLASARNESENTSHTDLSGAVSVAAGAEFYALGTGDGELALFETVGDEPQIVRTLPGDIIPMDASAVVAFKNTLWIADNRSMRIHRLTVTRKGAR
ncbi:glycosyltransferase [bacterium]|nr:glycosyltransferase [bacterium]